ncbi:restriction endonuclease subunit S [Dyella sp.]|uniref:restriction endonuclease subunit S n=1 Tax=Dyella sp. TaxID=1869338 RepID=UPI002D78A801|nr:restriction endonuclease subunit S [Dyella sp.]HET6432558.1 restriction endonuclease subunit S [Dyella sp.]
MSSELPQGWAWARIPDLVGQEGVFSDGDWVESKDQDPEGDVRLIQLADVGDGHYVNKSSRFLTREKAKELNCTFLQRSDVLIARMPDPLGRACIFPGDSKSAVTVVDVCIVRGSPMDLDQRWLMHFVNAEPFRQQVAAMQSGSTRKRISRGNLSTIELPVPPRAEQTRIVEKLEELLSDLDAGVAELKAAQRKLAQYRQSLLKAAVEGALTADWRAARARSGEPQEPGADLLQRILTERRARWEAKQLAKYGEQGKTPPKGWQAKYPEPVAPDTADLPTLPGGWTWASLDMVGEIASGVAKGMKRSSTASVREVPYLRVANVQRGYLDLTQIKTIEATEADIKELRLQPGDVLFNEGGDLDKLGRGWVWRGEVTECIHQNHVFRLRPYLPATPPELISHHGNTFGRTWFKTAGKQTTNLASINMTMLRAFPVPIAPEIESNEILAKLSPIIDAVAAQEMSVELGLKQAAAQRKNILKAAFAGQLVPQDPTDEPASALLSRIRTARMARAEQPRVRKTKQQKEAIVMAKKLVAVLGEAGDWMSAQDVFRHCGVGDGAETDQIEILYAELRALEKAGLLAVDTVKDAQGRKLHDRLKLLSA